MAQFTGLPVRACWRSAVHCGDVHPEKPKSLVGTGWQRDTSSIRLGSTGVYGYPKAEACEVAVSTVLEWLNDHELPEIVTFCCFTSDDAKLYQDQFEKKS